MASTILQLGINNDVLPINWIIHIELTLAILALFLENFANDPEKYIEYFCMEKEKDSSEEHQQMVKEYEEEKLEFMLTQHLLKGGKEAWDALELLETEDLEVLNHLGVYSEKVLQV